MWWLYFFMKFIICVLWGTLAYVPALLLLFRSGIVGDSMCWWVYSTPAKANMSADLVESIPYTWTSCEEKMGRWQREGIPGSCKWHDYPWGEWSTCPTWTPSTSVKGRQRLPMVSGCRTLLIDWSYVGPLLRTRVSLLTSLMSLSLSITCPSQCHRATLHPTTLTSVNFLSLLAIV